jgi:hypothetical protein
MTSPLPRYGTFATRQLSLWLLSSPWQQATTVVLSACCKEGSIPVNRGTPRYMRSAGHHVSPGTVVRFPSSQPIQAPPADLAPGWVYDRPRVVRGHQGAGIPSHRRRRRSGLGGRGQDRSAVGCSILTPTPQPASKQARRRDGIRAAHRCPAARQHPVYDCRLSLACPPRAPSHGHQGSTTVTHVSCRRVPAGQITAVQGHDRCPIFQAGAHV